MADTKLATIRAWIEAALGWSASGDTEAVIYRKQLRASSARPIPPYVAIGWTADVALETPYEYVKNEDPEPHPADPDGRYFDQYRLQRRRRTLSVTYFGDDPLDVFGELRASLHHVDEQAIIRDGGLAVVPAGGVVDTTELRSTSWEPAAAQDFFVFYTREDSDPVGVIETAKITSIDGAEHTFDVDPPIP